MFKIGEAGLRISQSQSEKIKPKGNCSGGEKRELFAQDGIPELMQMAKLRICHPDEGGILTFKYRLGLAITFIAHAFVWLY
jgi:hypothetical protein